MASCWADKKDEAKAMEYAATYILMAWRGGDLLKGVEKDKGG
jgi:hypothetical protein